MATAQNFNAKQPEPLKLVTDAVSNWKLWKQLWQNYAIFADIQSESRPPELIKSLCITTMGIEGLQIYNVCDPEDTDTVNGIIIKLDEHILGKQTRHLNATNSMPVDKYAKKQSMPTLPHLIFFRKRAISAIA